MKDGNSASQMSPWRPKVIKNEEKTHWKQQQQQQQKEKKKVIFKKKYDKKKKNQWKHICVIVRVLVLCQCVFIRFIMNA